MKVELVTKTQGVERYMSLTSDEIVEAVARHGKIKDAGKLIKYLIKHKHWSPLEHVHFTFRIETARDISAQMMRHRSFHWQELSQRYDVIQEFMPIEVRTQGKTNRQVGDKPVGVISNMGIEFSDGEGSTGIAATNEQVLAMYKLSNAISAMQDAYTMCIDAGIARECARRILPMCAKTVVHMTGNLRDFLGYLNVRCEAGTQKEHRDVAMAIGLALEKEFYPLRELDWKEGGFM